MVTTLDYLGWALQETGYQTDLIESDKGNHPYQELLVMLDPEAAGAEAVARLLIAEDMLPGEPDSDIRTLRLQLAWPLPIPKSAQMPELAHLLGVINRFMPLGSLSCNVSEGVVWKDSQPSAGANFPPPLVVEMLELLSDLIARWRPPLAGFLEGRLTFAAALSAIETPKRNKGDGHE